MLPADDPRVKEFLADLTLLSRRHGVRLKEAVPVELTSAEREGHYRRHEEEVVWAGHPPEAARRHHRATVTEKK